MNGCPPVVACHPAEGMHAFAEGAARCDCGALANVDDHAAIVKAARTLTAYLCSYRYRSADVALYAHTQLLADLLPPPPVGS